jgi:hypothetical protein
MVLCRGPFAAETRFSSELFSAAEFSLEKISLPLFSRMNHFCISAACSPAASGGGAQWTLEAAPEAVLYFSLRISNADSAPAICIQELRAKGGERQFETAGKDSVDRWQWKLPRSGGAWALALSRDTAPTESRVQLDVYSAAELIVATQAGTRLPRATEVHDEDPGDTTTIEGRGPGAEEDLDGAVLHEAPGSFPAEPYFEEDQGEDDVELDPTAIAGRWPLGDIATPTEIAVAGAVLANAGEELEGEVALLSEQKNEMSASATERLPITYHQANLLLLQNILINCMSPPYLRDYASTSSAARCQYSADKLSSAKLWKNRTFSYRNFRDLIFPKK